MKLFRKNYSVDYSRLISQLEKGDESDIHNLLWQPKNKRVNYLPITIELIQKLKIIENSNHRLTIHSKIEKSRFEILIFKTPWVTSDLPYSPLIIDKSSCKIVGVMLPFNEIIEYLNRSENNVINSLGVEWTGFVIKTRFKL